MKIRRRVYASGKVAYQLDVGVVDGKRVQKSYPNAAAARRALKRLERARERHGALGADLSPAEMAEIVAVRARLRAAGATLTEAAEFYLAQAGRLKERLLLPELARRFRDDREARKKSVRYVRQLKVSLDSLAELYPLKHADEVTQEDVEKWLRAHPAWSVKTRANYLGDVGAMFEWALGKPRGHARVNPTLEIERDSWHREEVGTLHVDRCAELLRAAVAQGAWRILAYAVLGMFGGLRRAEIERLEWGRINLDEGTVVVGAADAKTAARRVVDLTANAVAWLKLIPEERRQIGKVIRITGFVDAWTVFRRELGWDVGHNGRKNIPPSDVKPVHGSWPGNALRHTFASMHYAQHQNEAVLQVQMGHRSAKMIHQHYRAVKTRAEAAAFWALAP